MSGKRIKKTNAMRLLAQAKIDYAGKRMIWMRATLAQKSTARMT